MYAVQVQNRNHPNFGDLAPNDGGLWVTFKLSDAANAALPLAVGPAKISITSPKLTQTTKTGRPEGIYEDIAIEILPGTGTPSLSDQQYLAYQTEGFLTVRPNVSPTVTVGGAQFEIVFDAGVTTGEPIELSIVPQHHDPNARLTQHVSDNGDGTKTLRAIVTNPTGFAVTLDDWSQGMSTLYDLDMAIVGGNSGWIANADVGNFFTVTANSFYIDVNGEPIPGIAPTIVNEAF
jgi:hypothetical protein